MVVLVRLQHRWSRKLITLSATTWEKKKRNWQHLYTVVKEIKEPEFVTQLRLQQNKKPPLQQGG